jgi:hypothetical protein
VEFYFLKEILEVSCTHLIFSHGCRDIDNTTDKVKTLNAGGIFLICKFETTFFISNGKLGKISF